MSKYIGKVVRILAAVLLTAILVVAATSICAVRLLDSRQLTALVCRIAESQLDAEVSIDSIELQFSPSFPRLKVDVRRMLILSHAFDSVPTDIRASLPAYADTLLAVERIEGSIDIIKYLTNNEISLHRMEITSPEINIVLTSDKANFDIYKSEPDTAAVSSTLPGISIDRFAILEPRVIRFYNAVDSTEATIVLLSEMALDGRRSPDYSLRIDGDLKGPLPKSLLELDDMRFGINGRVHWTPKTPGLIVMEEMNLYGAFLQATVDANVRFDNNLTIESVHLTIDTLRIADAITALGSATIEQYRLMPPYFVTDGTASIEATLNRPYCFETDRLPFATIEATLHPCSMQYGKSTFQDVSMDACVTIAGDDIDSTRVVIKNASISGPATSLQGQATVTCLGSDPKFDIGIKGVCKISNLPPVVADAINGYMSGSATLDLSLRGTQSMLTSTRFHELNVEGSLATAGLYFVASDTAHMVEIPTAKMTFDSRRRVLGSDGIYKTLMSAHLQADTATILTGGVTLRVGGLDLGAAALNTTLPKDTNEIIPVGGGLKLRNFAVLSITDSAGMRLRGLEGRVVLNRFRNESKLPILSLDAKAARIVAGNNTNMLSLSDALIQASTHKIPDRAHMRARIQATADSIRHRHPELSPDSVYRLAVERRLARPHRKRTKIVEVNDEELIDWGVSNSLKRYLLDWDLEGTIATRRARLYTPFFPLRSRISQLDIHFTTDSIELRGLRYRAGKSDLEINGLISNIKKAFTSRTNREHLKANFAINSDTIDVNELAQAAFSGSAYAQGLRHKIPAQFALEHEGDSDWEQRIEALANETPDTSGPLLIPANVDADIEVSAHNILYSDLHMHNLGGNLLLYDGAVNINNLNARSDAGSLELSALYSAPRPEEMKFGFGLMLNDFRVDKFLNLVPAVDSIIPLMRDFSGIIDAEIAATVDIDSAMNFVLPTLDAAIKLSGDSLAFINPDTYRTLGKWLRFRDRTDNTIKHMSVEMLVRDNKMELFPFTFDIDRYRLGVVGSNDLALNFNYHIAVLKSPIPFKFGINIKGNPKDYKVRFGGAKFNEKDAMLKPAVVDTARVNLVRQIQTVFRRGIRNSRFTSLGKLDRPNLSALEADDSLTPADSTVLIQQGIIEAPADTTITETTVRTKKKRKK